MLNETVTDEDYHEALEKAHDLAVGKGITHVMEKHNLDALVLPAWSWMSIYTSWASRYFLKRTNIGTIVMVCNGYNADRAAEQPVVTVPLGACSDGQPYGLQFVGRRFEDDKLLQIARLYETTFRPRLVPNALRWKRICKLLPWKSVKAASRFC